MAGFGLGGITSKLKGISVNKIINLGFGLWGIQLGISISSNVMLSMSNQLTNFPIKSVDMLRLINIGGRIGQSALIARFLKNLPFGNYLAPIVGFSTAATVLPDIVNVMLSVSGLAPSTTIQNYPSQTSMTGTTPTFLGQQQQLSYQSPWGF